MAEVGTANEQFLQSKWGPAPVWVWALLGLVAAYMYNRYKANQAATQTAQTTAGTTGQAEGQAVAPQFVIENNEAPESQNVTVGGIPGTPTGAPPPPNGGPVKPPIGGGNPPTGGPPISVPPSGGKGGGKSKPPIEYRVPAGSGESFTSIAKKFGYKAGGQALYQYNITSSPHTAKAKEEMKSRGPNLLYGNELVYIPQT